MPTDWTDGVLGLEARHQWNGGVVLNAQEPGGQTYPWYRLDRITGLHGLGDSDDQATDPRTGAIGERLRPAQRRGKTVIYEGRVMALTLESLRQASRALRGAFADLGRGTMEVTPHPSYGSDAWVYTGRNAQADLDDDQSEWSPEASPTPYQRKFVVGVRMDDPRIYQATENDVWASAGDSINVHNSGTAPTDSLRFDVRIDDASTTITLVSAAQGSLVFSGFPSTGWLLVNFSDAAALGDPTAYHTQPDLSGSIDAWQFLNYNLSDWWDPGRYGLLSGDNNVGVTGGDWHVHWRSADW